MSEMRGRAEWSLNGNTDFVEMDAFVSCEKAAKVRDALYSSACSEKALFSPLRLDLLSQLRSVWGA